MKKIVIVKCLSCFLTIVSFQVDDHQLQQLVQEYINVVTIKRKIADYSLI